MAFATRWCGNSRPRRRTGSETVQGFSYNRQDFSLLSGFNLLSCCISINTFSVKVSASDCLLIFKGMLNIHSNKVSTHVWQQTESSHSQANAEHPEKFVGKE